MSAAPATALRRTLARLAEDPQAGEDPCFRDELLAAVVEGLGGDFARVAGYIHALAGRKAGASDVVLTPREREVLALVAHGMSSKAIGERLAISPRTAETHRARLALKLGAHGPMDLLRHAVARGLVDLGTW